MDFPMKRLPSILCAAGALLAAAAVVVGLARRTAAVTLSVTSQPAGASVFRGNECIGRTPLPVVMRAGERRELRLVKRDYVDRSLFLRADDFLPRQWPGRTWAKVLKRRASIGVTLAPAATATLVVTSQPTGAAFFLNGRREGVTPVVLGRLRPGTHAIRLEHPDCHPERFEAMLAAGRETRIRRRLRSKVVSLYREMIAKEPGSLMHYADLAHYYVIEGDYARAEATLKESLEVVKRADATDHNQYFWELFKIYSRWFTYPEDGDMAKIRPLSRKLMERARDEKLWSAENVARYLKQMDQYDQAQPGR